MKTFITLEIDHSKPLPVLPEMVAGRAYSIQGVSDVAIVEVNGIAPPQLKPQGRPNPVVSELEKAGFTADEIRLGVTEVERT